MNHYTEMIDALNMIKNEVNDMQITCEISNKFIINNKISKLTKLDEIMYQQICKKNIINIFTNWYNKNVYHTFPKKEHRWLNTFTCQKNLRTFTINLTDLPFYLQNIYKNFYNIIYYNENFNYMIIELSPKIVYDYLLESNKLYKNGKKVSIYISQILTYSTNKRKISDEDNSDEDNSDNSDIMLNNNNKKIKYISYIS